MKLYIVNSIIKMIFEGILFIIITIILFNEFTQILKTLNLFKEENLRLIGILSFLLATNNLLSNRFLGINIFK